METREVKIPIIYFDLKGNLIHTYQKVIISKDLK